MDKELQILNEIWENDNVSQRKLAKKIGQSLGTINGIIHKMVDEGMVIITQKSAKTIRYTLTPKGIEIKAKKEYEQIVNGFKVISKLKMNIKKIIEEQVKKGIKCYYIYGEKDEVSKIVKMSLIEAKRKHHITYDIVYNINDIDNSENNIILTWKPTLKDNSNKIINILNYK